MVEAVRKPGSVPAAGYPFAGDGHSSGTAVADGLEQSTRKHGRAVLDASLFDLAPGGVYLASGVTVGPGELLPHPFTLTPGNTGGGLLSVALALGLPPPGITRHPALRSSDFPPALTGAGDRLAAPDTGPYMTTSKKKQGARFTENP